MRQRLQVDDCWLEADLIEGVGGPVVYLHGAGQTTLDGNRIFGNAGIERPLLFPDSRGHGQSVEGDFTKQSWQQLIDDACAWLDHIDARDAVVTGVSMGAIIAPAVALARPDRVTSLVPIYPVFLGRDAEPDEMHWTMLQLLLSMYEVPDPDTIIEKLSAVAPGQDLSPVRDGFAHHRELAGVSAYFNADRTPQSLPYTTDDLRAMDMPVTVVGGADPFHPPNVAQALAEIFPNARLVELIDVAPEEHEAAMAQAVREHLATL